MSYAGPGRGVAKTVQTRFDAKTMVDNPKVSASTGMVDDGTGVKEVFRVEMFDAKTMVDNPKVSASTG